MRHAVYDSINAGNGTSTSRTARLSEGATATTAATAAGAAQVAAQQNGPASTGSRNHGTGAEYTCKEGRQAASGTPAGPQHTGPNTKIAESGKQRQQNRE